MNRRLTFVSFALLVTLALVVAWFAPTEETLGEAVKLIYLHAGLIYACLALLTGIALLGLVNIVVARGFLREWLWPVKVATLSFWVIYLLTSLIAMQLTWGAIVWAEPRLLLGASLFLVLLAAYVASTVVRSPRLTGLLDLASGAVVWILISRVPTIMHPSGSPIRSSPSWSLKLSVLAITVLLLASAFELARFFRARFSSRT